MGNILKITILLSVCAVMIGGCDSIKKTGDNVVSAVTGVFKKEKSGEEKIEIVTANQEKAELLGKIERKYESPEAHYKLGKLYLADALWNKAEWEFNVALGFDPIHYRSQAALIKTLTVSGNAQRATFATEMYMNQAATSAERSLLLGQAFQKESLDDQALACYQQALGLAPSSAALYRQVGYYYLSKGDRIRAEENLRRSFQLDPYQAEVAGELGRLGVIVQIPRKTQRDTKGLDKLLNKKE
ncbi:MAG: hypothetical protein KAJ07_12290 [Planctomycetes bacterium]|nr:hypothetical protein [Planctomycetota bacterium]